MRVFSVLGRYHHGQVELEEPVVLDNARVIVTFLEGIPLPDDGRGWEERLLDCSVWTDEDVARVEDFAEAFRQWKT